MNLFFRDGRRPPVDQQPEKFERFQREMDFLRPSQQLPAGGVEGEITDTEAHNPLRIDRG